MSLESQLFERTKQYLSRQISFNDLAQWTQLYEEVWSVDPEDKAGQLSGIVMLMAYEVWDGSRPEDGDPESARSVISEEASRIMGASSLL